MCGRFSLFQANDTVLLERFHASHFTGKYEKRYNIAPSQNVSAILNEDPKAISPVRWGLVPFWAKDPAIGNRMINARAEGIEDKPSFRKPIRSRRCLIIADGFYEWKREEKAAKRPFRVTLKDGALFSFAGIWDTWGPEGKELHTCSIITTEANSLVRRIHDRMPVILREEDEPAWLGEKPLAGVLKMLKPYDASEMAACEISSRVNSPANDSIDVTRPVATH